MSKPNRRIQSKAVRVLCANKRRTVRKDPEKCSRVDGEWYVRTYEKRVDGNTRDYTDDDGLSSFSIRLSRGQTFVIDFRHGPTRKLSNSYVFRILNGAKDIRDLYNIYLFFRFLSATRTQTNVAVQYSNESGRFR